MTWPEFLASVLATVASILAVVGTAAASYAIAYFRVKTLEARKRIEELDRDTIKSAVKTSLMADLSIDPTTSTPVLVTNAAKYLFGKGASDAVKAFNLSASDVGRKVAAEVPEARLKAESLKPC